MIVASGPHSSPPTERYVTVLPPAPDGNRYGLEGGRAVIYRDRDWRPLWRVVLAAQRRRHPFLTS